LVAEATRRVENYEHHFKPRERARKERDRRTFEATVAAVLSDLIIHALSRHEGRVAITLSKEQLARRSRYRPPALNARLPDILEAMASPELGLVDMIKGWHDLDPRPDRDRYRQTAISAGALLHRWIARDGIGFADFARNAAEELIVLRGAKRPRKGGTLKADMVDYADDALTVRLRGEMQEINARLAHGDMGLAGAFPHIDTGDRRLRRVFNNATFNHGGRLAGGWWTNLPKAFRREHVRIKGERIATLDYDALYARLAYARAGVEPPLGDLYSCIPGLEAHRKGAKVLLNSLLFDHGAAPRSRKPMGSAEMLPKGISASDLIAAIERTHRTIAPLFGRGIGFELMNTESTMMVAVLLRLRPLGIVGLPVHDAVIVARSDVDAAAGVMMMVAEDVTGHCLPVTVDAEEEDVIEEDDQFDEVGCGGWPP
jgi:hypothetical protein